MRQLTGNEEKQAITRIVPEAGKIFVLHRKKFFEVRLAAHLS